MGELINTVQNLQKYTAGKKYNTIYADPPWQFQNRTGKVAPEHKRLTRYETMTLNDIKALPVAEIAGDKAHLYLWVPNALLPDGLAVMDAWGFEYKGNIVCELEYIRATVEKKTVEYNGMTIRHTLTIGAAFYDGAEDIESLINEADKKLYTGKETSRNCVVYE